MYLSKIELDFSNRENHRSIGDCQRLHRMVTGLFGVDRASGKILFRVREQRGGYSLYLYSDVPIQPEKLRRGMTLAGERDVSHWLAQMEQGQIWQFDLLAWPSQKVVQGMGQNSRRRILRTQQERMSWLSRKGEQNGFELVQCLELESGHQTGQHPAERGGRLYVDSYHYQGVLRITDAEQFRAGVKNGIGPGKAYGLGMLLLNRV